MPAPPKAVTLLLNKPVTTEAPQLTVAGMAPGTYVFALVVRDDIGTESRPASLRVVVGAAPPNQ